MKLFPVMAGYHHPQQGIAYVPLVTVEAHEAQCQANHQQSAARLAERGGLSWCELIAVLENRPWTQMDAREAAERATAYVIRVAVQSAQESAT